MVYVQRQAVVSNGTELTPSEGMFTSDDEQVFKVVATIHAASNYATMCWQQVFSASSVNDAFCPRTH